MGIDWVTTTTLDDSCPYSILYNINNEQEDADSDSQ